MSIHRVGSTRSGESPLRMQFRVSNALSNVNFLEHVVLTASLSIEFDNSWQQRYTPSDFKDFVSNYATDIASVYRWLEDPHPRRGDIKIELISPQGTNSTLLPYRKYDFVNYGDYSHTVYTLWPFMSVHYWGENPVGDWTMIVTFKSARSAVHVSDVELALYGTSDVPQAVASIPQTCDEKCARGCYGNGSKFCDVCEDLRVVSTFECVATCPENFTLYKNSYCTETKISSDSNAGSVSILAIAIGTSVGLVSVIGLIACIVVSCILVYACQKKKNEGLNRQRYRVLPSQDKSLSVPV